MFFPICFAARMHFTSPGCSFSACSLEKLCYISGSQSGVPRPATSVSPGNLFKMQILGPYPDLLNQKLWCRSQESALTNPPGDSYVSWPFRITVPDDHQGPPALICYNSLILEVAGCDPWIEQGPLRGAKYFSFSWNGLVFIKLHDSRIQE